MKRGILVTMIALSLLLSVAYVQAAAPSGATLVYQNDLGELPAAAPGSTDIESGNITMVSLDTNVSTYRWAGILGNVSGNIVLGDALSNQMYTWVGEGRLIYASTAGSLTWTSLADADQATVEAAETYIATAQGADNYAATFTGASENIGSGIFSSITSDYASTDDNTATPTWKTYSLTDGSNLVWAGLVSAAGTAYNAETIDFQMIVPEDGTAGNIAATAYNLWVELV